MPVATKAMIARFLIRGAQKELPFNRIESSFTVYGLSDAQLNAIAHVYFELLKNFDSWYDNIEKSRPTHTASSIYDELRFKVEELLVNY